MNYILAAYIFGAVSWGCYCCFRAGADNNYDKEDWIFASLLGLIWPLVGLPMGLYYYGKKYRDHKNRSRNW